MPRLVELPNEPSLLGADFAAVRRRYGPPLGCVVGNGLLRFAYPGARGVLLGAVVVADGVVVAIAPDIRSAPAVPGTRRYLGAHLDEVLHELGPLRHRRCVEGGTELTFATVVLTLCEDCIVAVQEAPAVESLRA